MKNVILNFENSKTKARKFCNKNKILSELNIKENDIIQVNDSNSSLLAGIIEKNKGRISDMFVLIIGNENFNPTKVRYKHKFEKMRDNDQIYEMCDRMLEDKDSEIEQLKLQIKELKEHNQKLQFKLDNISNVINDNKDASCSYQTSKNYNKTNNQNPTNNSNNCSENIFNTSNIKSDFNKITNNISLSEDIENTISQNNLSQTNKIANIQINTSKIDEIYNGEIKDIIIKTLIKERTQMELDNNMRKSRKFFILTNIINSNKDFPKRDPQEIIEAFKNCVNDYGTLTKDGISSLQRLGFSICKEKTCHYKLTFNNDDKVIVLIGSTPSDKRVKNNLIKTFKNKFFGY